MTGKRQRYAADFKAKVALEALRGELTIAPLVTKHGVHQTPINAWKRQAVEGLAAVFAGDGAHARVVPPAGDRRALPRGRARGRRVVRS